MVNLCLSLSFLLECVSLSFVQDAEVTQLVLSLFYSKESVANRSYRLSVSVGRSGLRISQTLTLPFYLFCISSLGKRT